MSLDEIDALQAQGRWQETIEPLRKRVDAGSHDPGVLLRYGAALSQTGAQSQAFWPLQEAARDPEFFIPATMRLAYGAFNTGNHDLAIEFLGGVLEKDPEHLSALEMRSLSRLYTRRDYQGALEDAERALELAPGAGDMQSARIVALLGLKRIDEAREAIDAFDAEAEADDDEGEREGEREESGSMSTQVRVLACVGRAKFAQEDGKPELAAERFSKCADKYPAEMLAVVEAAKFFADRGEIDRVDAIYRRAYEAAPENRTFRVAMARRRQLLGHPEEARKILEEAADAGYPGALIDLAGFLADQGETDDAIDAYRQARALGASGANFLLSFGELLISTGQYDEALSIAEETGPESHKAFIRGRVALARREYEKALDLFTRGVLLWPDNAIARYYTALAAERVGDIDRAIEEYRNALRIDAEAADARVRLGRLHLAEGNPEAALYIIRYRGQGNERIRRNFDELSVELEGIGAMGQFAQLPPDLVSRIRSPTVWGEAVAAVARGLRRHEGDAGVVALIEGADRLDLTVPSSGPALLELVKSLDSMGRFDEAIARARNAVEANPGNAELQSILAEALLSSGRLADAEAAFGKVLAIDGDYPAGLLGRARIALARNQPEAAIRFLEPLAGSSSEAARLRAEAFTRLGRLDEARTELEAVLEADPYDGASALAMAELERSRKASGETIDRWLARAKRFAAMPSGEGGDAPASTPD